MDKNLPIAALSVSQFELLLDEKFKKLIPKKSPFEGMHTRNEVCKMLKISLPTLERYLDLGIIKAGRIGNRILISDEDIENALKNL